MNINKLVVKFMKLRMRITKINIKDPYFFTKILQKEGIEVGSHTIFYDPLSQTIDRERPWMLKIGDYCKITKGTTILTHDYSRSVLRRVYGDVIGESGITIIGDNVFIGMNSIILMGAHIGSNVIVGAGSVVSGTIPDNCVIAGNPARVIRSLEQHYNIRKKKSLEEAKIYCKSFYEAYGRYPSIVEMNAFFPLYMKRDRNVLDKSGVNYHMNGDCSDEIMEAFLKTDPVYADYEDFLKEVQNYEIQRKN